MLFRTFKAIDADVAIRWAVRGILSVGSLQSVAS